MYVWRLTAITVTFTGVVRVYLHDPGASPLGKDPPYHLLCPSCCIPFLLLLIFCVRCFVTALCLVVYHIFAFLLGFVPHCYTGAGTIQKRIFLTLARSRTWQFCRPSPTHRHCTDWAISTAVASQSCFEGTISLAGLLQKSPPPHSSFCADSYSAQAYLAKCFCDFPAVW
jgi:hypothetical protein